MNRWKRKHTTKGKCRCWRCEAIAAGKTPAQADKDMRNWEKNAIANHGWYVHFIERGDDQSPTGYNAHTHGLQEGYGHADFQLVVPLPAKHAHPILIALAERVKAGEKFAAEQKVAGVIVGAKQLEGQELLVKLVAATEGGRLLSRQQFRNTRRLSPSRY